MLRLNIFFTKPLHSKLDTSISQVGGCYGYVINQVGIETIPSSVHDYLKKVDKEPGQRTSLNIRHHLQRGQEIEPQKKPRKNQVEEYQQP